MALNIQTRSEERTNHNFRNAFILKPGFDFSSLKPHCRKLVYATDGFVDEMDSIRSQLEEAFQRYDPERDVLIPVGNTTVCFMAGWILQRVLRDRGLVSPGYYMGIYQEGQYDFLFIPSDPKQESYRVL